MLTALFAGSTELITGGCVSLTATAETPTMLHEKISIKLVKITAKTRILFFLIILESFK
jgi:hypothetical protein